MLGIPDSVMPHVRRFGFSGVIAVGIVVVMLFGINPVTLLTGQVAEPLPHTTLTALAAIEEGTGRPEDLVGAVQREADGFWSRAFRSGAIYYPPVSLVMAPTNKALGCGMAGAEIGTFYCPEDKTVYVDMEAYARLVAARGSDGHIAEGYLIGVAFGHHVQNALGELDKLAAARPGLDPQAITQREQQLAAQAACYGGIWAKAAGLQPLFDAPGTLAAIDAGSSGSAISAAPSHQTIPETFAQPDAAARRFAFNLGFAIPAAGSCRLDKVVAPVS